MGSLTLYQIITGYYTHWIAKGVYFNIWTIKFLFEWFSMLGFVRWTIDIALGNTPLTFIAMIGIFSTLLTYPLYLFSILKYDRKLDIWHFLAFFFMSPFWFILMIIQLICIPEYFRKKQYNIWKKNE